MAVFDSNYEHMDASNENLDNSLLKKGDTIADLAQAMDMNEASLTEAANTRGLSNGPFYAVPVVGLQSTTLTGVRTDDNLHVLNTDGNVYAIGEVAFGNLMYDADPIPGNCAASAIYMGKIAAYVIIIVEIRVIT